MGRRREQRKHLSTVVRVFGTDAKGTPFSRTVETIDVSPSGLRVSGMFVELREGDEVEIECERGRARCRVIWHGEVGTPKAGELALCTVDPTVVLWPVEGADWADDFDAALLGAERRFYRRFECDLPAYFAIEGSTVLKPAKCIDLGFGGCYLETAEPLPTDARLSVSVLPVVTSQFNAVGFVRTSHPGVGMGVRFTHVADAKGLASILDMLRTAAPPPSRSVRIASPEPATAGVKENKTILVVDDSLSARNLIAHHLRRHGYSVLLARHGEEGLAIAKSSRPDIILLDILMPRLSGLAVLRRLKADPATADIPVLVISSLSEDNDARLLAEGACAYFAKASTPPESLPLLVDRTFEHLLKQTTQTVAHD
jgi:CheY-like chemotaxis protein